MDIFLINYKARLLNVINRKDGKNFPAVYNVCSINGWYFKCLVIRYICAHPWFYKVIMHFL